MKQESELAGLGATEYWWYGTEQIEVLQDRIATLERHNRELRKLNNRSIWRIIKDRMILILAR